ncbi:hypothetical protein [Limosilactobacillus reuteri]|uniref:hypothetical protein n=1 Tax=Limosilactobacillus reuteri TaxID=1598 RepID=UPI001E36C1C9|nr:hypothetical protein [Limosilactobacillus reuteri]MCC4389096.1 hypothetical protein [Limosilactobacillus reuteri]MCC4427828.1 hypothetical protein [Limosilactobacillus reuteri]MCC4431647.1 hypothetical protein [Limosilactobacillus reuteri]MCC4433922.1 hypothetical protein [Limosilactobacillus reuteri]
MKDYERYFHSFEKGEFGSNLLGYLRGDRVREMGWMEKILWCVSEATTLKIPLKIKAF